MNISIFGGCYCSEYEYEQAYAFVKEKLKRSDIKIINGATIGTMEATSKAAAENNINVVGCVLNKYKQFINNYINEIHLFDNEMDRMKYVCENSDMYIVLDGDLGTKEELFIVLLMIENLNKQIVIIGEKTKKFLNYCFDEGHLSKTYKEKIRYSTYDEFTL